MKKEGANQAFGLYLTPQSFRLWWLGIGFFHGINLFFLLGVTWIALWLLLTPTAEYYFLDGIDGVTFAWQLSAFPLLGLCHVWAIGRMIYSSIQARHLRFWPLRTQGRQDLSSNSSVVGSFRIIQLSCLGRMIHLLRATWRSLFGSKGLFGAHGALFEAAFGFREIIEIVSQTYQAYCLSYNVTNSWINHFAVTCIALNCFAMPLISWLVHRSFSHKIHTIPANAQAFKNRAKALERVVCLLSDAVLDFCGSAIVPVCILIPHVINYDPAINFFPIDLVYDDVWYIKSAQEWKQLLFTSRGDYLSSLLPHLSMILCLMTLKGLLHRQEEETHHLHSKQASAIMPSFEKEENQLKILSRQQNRLQTFISSEFSSRIRRFTQICFVLWGVGVLIVHAIAQKSHDASCRHQAQTWFVQEVSCSVMQVNCHQLGIKGYANELEAQLQNLHRDSLSSLIFVHCPRLHIPSNIAEFPYLLGMDIYNSTLVEWSEAASIKEETTPLVSYVFFTLTNITAPRLDGLLHPDLPVYLTQFAFEHCIWPNIPEDLDRYWTRIESIFMDYGSLTEIPPVLTHMKILSLSLIGNLIQELPDELFRDLEVNTFRLTGNPLTKLPTKVGDTTYLEDLLLEYTNLTVLPTWIYEWYDEVTLNERTVRFSVYGSPYCDICVGKKEETLICQAACHEDLNSTTQEYPLDLVMQQRPF